MPDALLKKCDKTEGGRGALKAVTEYIEEPVSYLLLDPDVFGIKISVNDKDIEIRGVKSLDKTAALESNQIKEI